MNIKSTQWLLVAAAITANCSGQITATNLATSSPTLVTTNIFSNWKDHWTNLTVTAPCPPWGCSLTLEGYVYVGADHWPTIERKGREALQQRAKLLGELEKEEELRKLLNAPALSETYRVSLSRRTNSIGQKP